MNDDDFHSFFRPYARNVDGFYEVAYWRLADEVIRRLIDRHLGLWPGCRVLDVGGGTGRWAVWLVQKYNAEVTVFDKSPDMLECAELNVVQAGVENRVTLLEGDIEDAPTLQDSSYDAVLSTYGVLSFLSSPLAAFDTISRVMRPGSTGLLMSHSLSNAMTTKICRDGASPGSLLELWRNRIVQWAEHVPPLRVFTADDLKGLARNAGLIAPRVFGVTTLALPGAADFG